MKLLVESDPLRIRTALLEGDRLVEAGAEGREVSSVGSVHLGRVQRVAPAIDAAFVDLGLPRKAFLHADDFALDAGEELRVHQHVVVQIFRDAVPGKGVRIRRGANLPGRYLVLISAGSGVAVSSRIEDPDERARLIAAVEACGKDSVGWIVRTAAAGLDEASLGTEAEALFESWLGIQRAATAAKPPALLHSDADLLERWSRDRLDGSVREIWVDSPEVEARMRRAMNRMAPEIAAPLLVHEAPPNLFERFGVESQLAELWRSRVPLPSGGSLVVQPTEALVAIDVNSGRDLGASSLEKTALATNLEAAREVARQLRLRDLAGIIVIDFIDMSELESWEEVRRELDRELARDRATTLVDGPTAFGLVAITRKRARNDLLHRLSIECSECGGSGRLRSPVEVAAAARRALLARAAGRPASRWRLRVHPSVTDGNEPSAHRLLSDLALQLEDRLEVEAVETVRRDRFEIVEAGP